MRGIKKHWDWGCGLAGIKGGGVVSFVPSPPSSGLVLCGWSLEVHVEEEIVGKFLGRVLETLGVSRDARGELETPQEGTG